VLHPQRLISSQTRPKLGSPLSVCLSVYLSVFLLLLPSLLLVLVSLFLVKRDKASNVVLASPFGELFHFFLFSISRSCIFTSSATYYYYFLFVCNCVRCFCTFRCIAGHVLSMCRFRWRTLSLDYRSPCINSFLFYPVFLFTKSIAVHHTSHQTLTIFFNQFS